MSYVLIKNETSVPIWVDCWWRNIPEEQRNSYIQPGDVELFNWNSEFKILSDIGSCVYFIPEDKKKMSKTFGNLNVKEGQNKNFDTKTLIITEMPED